MLMIDNTFAQVVWLEFLVAGRLVVPTKNAKFAHVHLGTLKTSSQIDSRPKAKIRGRNPRMELKRGIND